MREASILSICPHAKRVASSVPLQCTNELVRAGADELGAAEEESEEEAAPQAKQADHEADSPNAPIKSSGYQRQPYQHPPLSTASPLNAPIKSIPPANSSAAVCGLKTKSARGGAKPVAVSLVASGSASRRGIGTPKPAAETCWHNVRARVNTGRKVRNPPPQPPREAVRTLKHRPLVPSPTAREIAAAERALAALEAAALAGVVLAGVAQEEEVPVEAVRAEGLLAEAGMVAAVKVTEGRVVEGKLAAAKMARGAGAAPAASAAAGHRAPSRQQTASCAQSVSLGPSR